MSDSAAVTQAWSSGETLTKPTRFQALGGAVWIATGDSAPAKNIAGNQIQNAHWAEIEAGETVYWRTDEQSPVFVSWLETGSGVTLVAVENGG